MSLAATLFDGLSYDSRIKKKLAGRSVDLDTLCLAAIVDRLNLILGSDAESLVNILLEIDKAESGFENGTEFMAAWAEKKGG